MQYVVMIAELIFIVMLMLFVVLFGMKVCSFLDGLAKQNNIEGFPEGFPFDQLIRKPNRTKKEHSIRSKLKARREQFDKRERRE